MVTQMWQQSPVIMLMVSGLLVFGAYSVIAYFRDRPAEEPPAPGPERDPALFETIPHGYDDGTGGVLT